MDYRRLRENLVIWRDTWSQTDVAWPAKMCVGHIVYTQGSRRKGTLQSQSVGAMLEAAAAAAAQVGIDPTAFVRLKLVELHPTEAVPAIDEALRLLDELEVALAVKSVSRERARGPILEVAHQLRALNFGHTGHIAEARELIREAVRLGALSSPKWLILRRAIETETQSEAALDAVFTVMLEKRAFICQRDGFGPTITRHDGTIDYELAQQNIACLAELLEHDDEPIPPAVCRLCGKELPSRDADRGTCHDCRSPAGKLAELDIAIRSARNGEVNPDGMIDELFGPIRHQLRERFGQSLSDGELWQRCRDWLAAEGIKPNEYLNWPRERLQDLLRGVVARAEHTHPANRHSTDYCSALWDAVEYTFTTMQAACVGVLWKNWEQGTPTISEATILEEAGSAAARLRDVFDKGQHPAWGTVIIPAGKGRFRLSGEPPKS